MPRLALRSTQPPISRVLLFFTGVKQPGLDVGHSPPSSAEVKNVCEENTSTPPVCLHGMEKENFNSVFLTYGTTLYLY